MKKEKGKRKKETRNKGKRPQVAHPGGN